MINEIKHSMKEVSLQELGPISRKTSIDLLLIMILATAGAVLQISGTSWDITSRGLGSPETFFTAPHNVLYGNSFWVISRRVIKEQEFKK
jgi:hypothetical protein